MQISIAVLLHVQKGWVRCLIQDAAAVMPPLTASFREYMIQWNSFADLAKCKPRECFWWRISKISKTSLNKRSTELAVCCLWASSMSALFRPSTRDASCELVIQKAKSGWKNENRWKNMFAEMRVFLERTLWLWTSFPFFSQSLFATSGAHPLI